MRHTDPAKTEVALTPSSTLNAIPLGMQGRHSPTLRQLPPLNSQPTKTPLEFARRLMVADPVGYQS